MFRKLFKIIFIIVEKVLAEIALVAAFISTTWDGGLYQRVVGGLITLYRTIHGFGVAYAKNENFSDVWKHFSEQFDTALGLAGKNIENEPSTVLGAFVLTFACYKIVAWVLKTIRKNLLKRRPKVIKPTRPATRRKTGPAYDQLYEPPKMSPSTASYLDDVKSGEGRKTDDKM